MLFTTVKKFFVLVVCVFSRLFEVNCDTVSSPHIRILDVATKSSETRLIPHRIDYQNEFHPKYQQEPSWYEQNRRPLKSYVIYDEYPVKIFKEWKGDADFSVSRPPFLLELNRHPDAELTPDYYLRNRPQVVPPPKPTLAYHSVYSNIIKVFDDSLEDFGRNRFQGDRVPKPYDGGGVWKSFQPPVQYEPVYPQEIPRAPYEEEKLPDNFPKIFSPNSNFHFTPFNEEEPKPPKHFYPQRGYYDTHTINYNEGGKRHPDDVEFLPEIDTNPKNQKVFLCSFIRLNQKQFPESGQPCSRSEDNLPILAPEYPDYSNLPNDKIPVEHRRQHHQMKRIKRSGDRHSRKSRQKRASGLGYSYGTWSSPFGYENSYDGYLSDYYPSRGGYGSFGSNYGTNYYRNNGNRDRYQGYRNRYYSGSRSNYDDYDDEYQNNDDSNSRGLTSYLTSGGRRYKNRKNNDDDDNDDEENDNNRDEDSDEEMERQNSGRRGSNDRRNNDDSRDRRRNNNNNNSNSNNNDDDDSRDSRRNNNRQNGNSRRNNKRYNDRYDYNNRNRNSYGSNSGYGFSNGYGSSNGGYGNSYGSSNGYGTSGGYGNNGYGNSYGSHGGFGYGSGYGNGFSSI